MAYKLYRICGLIVNCAKNNSNKSNVVAVGLLNPYVPILQNVRNASFFCRKSAKELWKSVVSVSNAGRKRGRARGIPKTKDLNKGQKIGYGKISMMFPGLNSNLMNQDIVLEPQRLPDNVENEVKVIPLQSQDTSNKRKKASGLDRGWTGGLMGGRKIGPPDPIFGESFVGFNSVVLHFKPKSVMTCNMGRVTKYITIVVTGNGNGLAGFSSIIGSDSKSVLKAAKNRAGQRLMYFERYEDHTILHNFFTQFGSTKIFVEQRPKGFGLVCHRVIKSICECIGIKDMYAKVEGSDNVANVIKAFFIGLLQQKTYQQVANETKLHVVEFKKEHRYFPKVLASPAAVKKEEEIDRKEYLSFNEYLMNGRIPLRKKKRSSPFSKLPSYLRYERKTERIRDHDKVRIKLRAEYGDICSFFAKKYPEARVSKWRKHDKEVEEKA